MYDHVSGEELNAIGGISRGRTHRCQCVVRDCERFCGKAALHGFAEYYSFCGQFYDFVPTVNRCNRSYLEGTGLRHHLAYCLVCSEYFQDRVLATTSCIV